MKNPEWFEYWFNSPYYCLLYQNRNEEEASAFLEKILQVLNPTPAARILDLPCGRGRHSIYLAGKGYEVMGVDLSAESIGIAKKFENDHLTFAVHDMRELFYINYFDIALNLFTSIGYFNTERENLDSIRTFSNALKKGGKLVLDFMNTEKVIKEMKPLYEMDNGAVHFRIEKVMEGKILVKKIEVTDAGKILHFEERVMALTLADFNRYFSTFNLKITQTFGNYQLQPFNPNESERLILIAEKV